MVSAEAAPSQTRCSFRAFSFSKGRSLQRTIRSGTDIAYFSERASTMNNAGQRNLIFRLTTTAARRFHRFKWLELTLGCSPQPDPDRGDMELL
jgi:hypothetical protein